MTVSRQKKSEILNVLEDRFKRKESAVFISYRGTSVKDVNDLRSALFKEGLSYQVAKKTLVKLAAEKNNIDFSNDEVLGKIPFGIIFGYEDQVAACKISKQFEKKIETVEILGGVIDNKVVSKDIIIQYASLPSREESLAKFVGLVKAPLTAFHGACKGGLSGFARALSEYAKQKEA